MNENSINVTELASPIRVDYECRVPFYDVDVMGIVWHGHYVKYFEEARCALLDALDYNYLAMRASGFAWPVIDLQIKYAQPLRFQQTLVVTATVKDIDNGLLIAYVIRDKASGKRLTRGHTRQVAVAIDSEEMLLQSPAVLYDKVAAYTAERKDAI